MLSWRCSNIFSVKNNAREEIIEKKSRFIASVYPIAEKQDADRILEALKKEFWDANHNVYAYILPNNICKYSDDGEPQGTAGLPVFNVLQKKMLQNVLVVVTRYFGGTLLGKGGLVKAYTDATIKGVEAANIYEIIEYDYVELLCEYNIKDKLLYFLEKNRHEFTSDYFEKVKITVKLPHSDVNDFILQIVKLTENRINYNLLSKN